MATVRKCGFPSSGVAILENVERKAIPDRIATMFVRNKESTSGSAVSAIHLSC